MDKIKEEFKQLANDIKIELNDIELYKICQEYDSIINGLELIKKMDLKKIKPTSFVHNIKLNDLNNFNEEIHHDDKEELFKNCGTFNNNLVGIKDERK